MDSPSPETRTGSERCPPRRVIFWFTLWTLLAAVAAYLAMLTDFSPYDDEGALMITVKPYLAGMKLYDQIFTSYGPVYYFYRWLVHAGSGAPVTHDAVRLTALLPWLATCLICAWIALRLTRSLVVAGIAHFATSVVLVFFSWEPGHPQDLTILLLVMLAAVPLALPASRASLPGTAPANIPTSAIPAPERAPKAGTPPAIQRPRASTRRNLCFLALGALPAALLLVKINIGSFAALAVAFTLVSSGPPKRLWHTLAFLGGAACIALPPLLMRRHLDLPDIRVYCWLATLSIAACVICLLRPPRPQTVTARDCLLSVAGFLAAFCAVIAILLVQGVSVSTMYQSLVVLPARIFLNHPDWVAEPRLLSWTVPWSLTGLAAACFAAWKNPQPHSVADRVLFAGKAVFSGVALTLLYLDQPLLGVLPPFVWLLLFDPARPEDTARDLPRRLLAILTVLQVLYAYPIAGSQARFTQVLLRLAVVICIGDCLTWMSNELSIRAKLARWWSQWTRVAATAALTVIAAAHAQAALQNYRDYRAWPSLNLPGARLVHADRDLVANLQWLVRNLEQQCDSFESLPGLPSLYFWTGIAPLTTLTTDAWTISLSPAQQQRIIDAVAAHPRACIVFNPAILEQWNPDNRDLSNLPLVHYIFQNFHSAAHSGDYHLMLRNPPAPNQPSR